MWTGEGFHVIYYPLRERTEMNIVAVFQVPAGLDPSDNEGYRNYIDDTAANTQAEIRDVISVVNLERRWAIADRNPLRGWADGRVTLLGDSAHATLQSLAQGAGMALEDASALTALMAKDPQTQRAPSRPSSGSASCAPHACNSSRAHFGIPTTAVAPTPKCERSSCRSAPRKICTAASIGSGTRPQHAAA